MKKKLQKISSRASEVLTEAEARIACVTTEQASQIILQLVQQLGGKTEVHVHFIIDKIVVNNGNNGAIIIGNHNTTANNVAHNTNTPIGSNVGDGSLNIK
jgi:hypothetical protein